MIELEFLGIETVLRIGKRNERPFCYDALAF
jgi:hypothetical protein